MSPHKCKIPECQYLTNNWDSICDACMAATTRQFLHALGIWDIERADMPSKEIQEQAIALTKYIHENIDEILAQRIEYYMRNLSFENKE